MPSRATVTPRRALRGLTLLILLAFLPACAEGQRAGDATAGGGPALQEVLSAADASRSKGAEDAPVTIVEISDFQCPFCARWAQETLPALDSAYIQTGQVRMIYINYPLPTHGQAWSSAKAALCAGAQDAFWPMHDVLFEEQRSWSGQDRPYPLYQDYASRIGIDTGAFATCMENDQVAQILVGDLMQVTRAGITGTPTFVINNEVALSGHLTLEEMAEHIDPFLENGDRPDADAGTEEGPAGDEG
jgi:protein-disulfide isomerase